MTTTTKIIGIGNSAGIVIPAALLNSLNLKRNDRVILSETEHGLELQKAETAASFEDLLESYYHLPYAEAMQQFQQESDDITLDWGEPRGEEEW